MASSFVAGKKPRRLLLLQRRFFPVAIIIFPHKSAWSPSHGAPFHHTCPSYHDFLDFPEASDSNGACFCCSPARERLGEVRHVPSVMFVRRVDILLSCRLCRSSAPRPVDNASSPERFAVNIGPMWPMSFSRKKEIGVVSRLSSLSLSLTPTPSSSCLDLWWYVRS